MKPEKVMTIVFLTRETAEGKEVCLAEKLRGFRTGKINGYGGKLEVGETVRQCAIRETKEEFGVDILGLEKRGIIYFEDWNLIHTCHVFVSSGFLGEPTKSEEMAPAWYLLEEVPYSRMGQADTWWIPQILIDQQKLIAYFYYNEDTEMCDHKITILGEDKEFDDF